MIEGLHHIAILCSQKERAISFYVDALGFSLGEEHIRPERGDEIIMLRGYDVILELFISSGNPARVTGPEAYGLRHLAFRVTEIDSMVKALEEKGFSPEPIRRDSFTGEAMTFVKDPDGLPIELHE